MYMYVEERERVRKYGFPKSLMGEIMTAQLNFHERHDNSWSKVPKFMKFSRKDFNFNQSFF